MGFYMWLSMTAIQRFTKPQGILIQEPKNHGLAAPTCSSRKENVVKKSLK